MKNTLIVVIGTVLSIIVLATFVNYIFYSKDKVSKNDYSITEVLESQVLPFVQDNKIVYFFDSNWCQILETSDRITFKLIDDTATSNCGSRPSGLEPFPMSMEDALFFKEVRGLLLNSTSKKFMGIQIEKPLTSEIEHKSYPHSEIGIAFHINCDLCRTRYVYWQGYDELPPNIEGEIKYIPINENWYRVEQDWN